MDLCCASKHPLYGIWVAMKQRCTNENNHAWEHYGGRGISVCERWSNSFSDFLSDVGERPFDGAQLDRIDNNGNYEPGNTRWVTATENMKNRRDSSEWGNFYSGGSNRRTVNININRELADKLRMVCEADNRSVNFIANRGLHVILELFNQGKLKSNWDYEIP